MSGFLAGPARQPLGTKPGPQMPHNWSAPTAARGRLLAAARRRAPCPYCRCPSRPWPQLIAQTASTLVPAYRGPWATVEPKSEPREPRVDFGAAMGLGWVVEGPSMLGTRTSRICAMSSSPRYGNDRHWRMAGPASLVADGHLFGSRGQPELEELQRAEPGRKRARVEQPWRSRYYPIRSDQRTHRHAILRLRARRCAGSSTPSASGAELHG